MKVINELLSTPAGLASLGVIAFMVGMGWFLFVWIRRKMNSDE